MLALGDELAVRVDQQPAAVARQPPGLDDRLVKIDHPAPLQRVDVNRSEHAAPSVIDRASLPTVAAKPRWQKRWVSRPCCHAGMPARLTGMRTVLIVLFDGVQSLDVTGPLEVFSTASRLRTEGDAAPGYAITTASLGGVAVRTTSGLGLLPDADLASVADGPDLMVVPGGAGARRRDPDLVGWLRRNAPSARRLASVCTGAFLLAEAGLLTGRTVTTHWERCDDLAAQYPDVTVDPDPIFIKDRDLATSAGVTAGIDLALALVEDDLGREAALAVARQLVVF